MNTHNTQNTQLNGYICFYQNKQIEVYSNSSYGAQKEAQQKLRLKDNQRHKITVVLAELNGQQVTHIAAD